MPIEAKLAAARRLLRNAHGATHNERSEAQAAACVYGELVSAFAPILGGASVQALFARSIKRTMTNFPGLAKVVGTQEPFEADELIGQSLLAYLSDLQPGVASDVAATVFANFFGLMSTFIGEQLVWQIVKGVFPEFAGTRPEETV